MFINQLLKFFFPWICSWIKTRHVNKPGPDSDGYVINSVKILCFPQYSEKSLNFRSRPPVFSCCDMMRVFPVRSFLCRGAVRWSPSLCRTVLWPRWEPAGPNQRLNITLSSAPLRGKGEQSPTRCNTRSALCCVSVNVHTYDLCCSDVSSLEEELRKITAALLEEFLEPERNGLIRRRM